MADPRTYDFLIKRGEIASFVKDPGTIRKIEDLQRAVTQTTPDDVATAQTTADGAQTAAEGAQTTADTAVTNAATAQTAADAAQTAANAAQATADSKVEEAPEDGTPYVRQDGGWVSESSGGGGYEAGTPTVPTVSSFTWLNQGTSIATDGTGALILKPQVNGQLHSLIKAVPAAPFDVYSRVEVQSLQSAIGSTNTILGGFCVRNSANGNVVSFCMGGDETATGLINAYVVVQRWTASGATFSANGARGISLAFSSWKWLKLNVTSTTVTASVSFDGKNFYQVGTETISSFLGAITDYGVCAFGTANSTMVAAQFSYLSTTAPS